jgi:L-asparaginase II
MQKSEMSAESQQNVPLAVPLVKVTRGAIVESRHRGHVVAVGPDGNVFAFLGAPETVTYLRSSSKPHQAIPLLTSGAAHHFGFTEEEVALACASHNGEEIHTRIVASMLEKIGLDVSALKCGTHEPYGKEAAEELRRTGQAPNALHNNCSGKHTGMLALALYLSAPIDTYDQPQHPVQKAIANIISEFSGVPLEDIAVGVDGCGAPVFGVTVIGMARMYARLITPPEEFDQSVRDACRRITKAMTKYPELIGGSRDRLDTELMRATKGALVSKVGAEGVYTAGVLPCEQWPRGLGLAVKIEDGDDLRARPTVVIEALRQLHVLRDESLEAISRYAFFPIRNRRGDLVGEVTADYDLQLVGG